MSTKHNLKTDQRGVASLLFSLVMMLVISLIVLSFAQLARRGQREVLDSQLSNQAYYAAESGVNDAIKDISTFVTNGTEVPATGGCGNARKAAGYNHLYGALSDGVSYPCASVNPTPASLQLSNIGQSNSKVLNITPVDAIESMTLSWTTATTPTSASVGTCPSPNATTLPKAGSTWTCPYGMLRFDLVPTAGTLTRNGLLASTLSVFVSPSNSSAPVILNYGANTQQGVRAGAKCTADNCSITINNLPTATGSYAMRLMAKYVDASSVTLIATKVGGGVNTTFKDSQAIVDVTGKAQNVLRRLQVRVPLGGQKTGYPDYAIASEGSICKRFSVSINGTFSEGDLGCPTYEVTAADTDPVSVTPPPPIVPPTPPVVHNPAYYDCPSGGTLSGVYCQFTQEAGIGPAGIPTECPPGWGRNLHTCFINLPATYHPAT